MCIDRRPGGGDRRPRPADRRAAASTRGWPARRTSTPRRRRPSEAKLLSALCAAAWVQATLAWLVVRLPRPDAATMRWRFENRAPADARRASPAKAASACFWHGRIALGAVCRRPMLAGKPRRVLISLLAGRRVHRQGGAAAGLSGHPRLDDRRRPRRQRRSGRRSCEALQLHRWRRRDDHHPRRPARAGRAVPQAARGAGARARARRCS